MEMPLQSYQTGEFCPQYRAQHKPRLGIFVQSGILLSIYCNYGIIKSLNSLSWKGQGSPSPAPETNEKPVRGILQELVPALNTNTCEK